MKIKYGRIEWENDTEVTDTYATINVENSEAAKSSNENTGGGILLTTEFFPPPLLTNSFEFQSFHHHYTRSSRCKLLSSHEQRITERFSLAKHFHRSLSSFPKNIVPRISRLVRGLPFNFMESIDNNIDTGDRKCPRAILSCTARIELRERLVKYRVGGGAVNQGKPGDSRELPSSSPEDKCHGGCGGGEEGGRMHGLSSWR